MIQSGTHNPVLVVLSILVAVTASYTALDLAGRARAAGGRGGTGWLCAAALAMGGGVWSEHFVGMIAYDMPGIPQSYDVPMTLASLLVAVLVTGVGLLAIARRRDRATLLAAGLFVGAGIAAMHAVGMAAMTADAELRYSVGWSAASAVVAVGAATAALWLSTRADAALPRLASAVAMGLAVAGMHYTAMAGVSYVARPCLHNAGLVPEVSEDALAFGVAASTLMVLVLALMAASFDRRLATMAAREGVALAANRERFRRLWESTPLPLYALDGAGAVVDVSDAWLRLAGRDREAVLGRPLSSFLEGDSVEACRRDLEALLATGGTLEAEYRLVTREGAVLDVASSARVEEGGDDEGRRVIGGLADVTGRRQAEEALRQAQKIEAIGHLTGGVAHDFNNLLAVVIGNLDLLRKRLPDDPKAVRLLEGAAQGARRGAALTQRMLSFARKQELRPGPVDVHELVRGMADLIGKSVGPSVRVDTRFPLRACRAVVDPNQFELALLNLAVNARDAMPSGGTLTIATREVDVTAGGAVATDLAPGRYVCVSVADDGEGMDAATLARAADPFFTTKGTGKGTGLGLSMVVGLAAQSGGRLTIASERGRGTTIEAWLPAAVGMAPAPEVAADEAAPTPGAAPGECLRILVVDDDALVLASTAEMLEDLGHEVVAVGSGTEALATLRRGARVDALVTDHAMPGMTGSELARAARAERPGLPALLVSGFAELPDDPGGPRRLAKPFTQGDLAEAVALVTRGRRVTVLPLRPRRDRSATG